MAIHLSCRTQIARHQWTRLLRLGRPVILRCRALPASRKWPLSTHRSTRCRWPGLNCGGWCLLASNTKPEAHTTHRSTQAALYLKSRRRHLRCTFNWFSKKKGASSHRISSAFVHQFLHHIYDASNVLGSSRVSFRGYHIQSRQIFEEIVSVPVLLVVTAHEVGIRKRHDEDSGNRKKYG